MQNRTKKGIKMIIWEIGSLDNINFLSDYTTHARNLKNNYSISLYQFIKGYINSAKVINSSMFDTNINNESMYINLVNNYSMYDLFEINNFMFDTKSISKPMFICSQNTQAAN
jgi:hypothetical protein